MNDYTNILKELDFSLDEKQPHLGGERRVFAAHKLVLFGRRNSDGIRVVVKVSREAEGIKEIERERVCRAALDGISFAYGTFSSPEELLFSKKDGYAIQVTRFIDQDISFLERSTPEQFGFALKGLKAMEAAHAATYGHLRSIRGIFPTMNAGNYIKTFRDYVKEISSEFTETQRALSSAANHLSDNYEDIERYCGFLTHFDFLPQNIRIAGDTMYLLDHSSLRFGNKHESWARMINFMELYNTGLARALEKYVRDNRSSEEVESLHLMRLFRLGELLAHHARVGADALDDNLRELSRKRVSFWSRVLQSVFDNTTVPDNVISEYKTARDSLRSPEEKERQIGLH